MIVTPYAKLRVIVLTEDSRLIHERSGSMTTWIGVYCGYRSRAFGSREEAEGWIAAAAINEGTGEDDATTTTTDEAGEYGAYP